VSNYDNQYRLVISEPERRMILKSLVATLENQRRSSEDLLSRPLDSEIISLIGRLATIAPIAK
jgi:hypothetical protein